MAEQPVPMGMLRPETSTPMRDSTSEATPGELEFSTHWQHWGPAVVEPPEPPSQGAGAATTAVATKARVKSVENMAVVGVLKRGAELERTQGTGQAFKPELVCHVVMRNLARLQGCNASRSSG
jgi:hypothetical protein